MENLSNYAKHSLHDYDAKKAMYSQQYISHITSSYIYPDIFGHRSYSKIPFHTCTSCYIVSLDSSVRPNPKTAALLSYGEYDRW